MQPPAPVVKDDYVAVKHEGECIRPNQFVRRLCKNCGKDWYSGFIGQMKEHYKWQCYYCGMRNSLRGGIKRR